MDLLIRQLICVAAGLAFAFGSSWLPLAYLVLFPVTQGMDRQTTLRLCCAFFAAALLPAGIAAHDYTGSMIWAALSWAIPIALNALPLSLALSAKGAWRALWPVATIVLLSIPPLASVALVSPLSLAGILFPGMGHAGLILMMLLMVLLSAMSTRLVATGRRGLIAMFGLSLMCHTVAADDDNTDTTLEQTGVNTDRGMPDPLESEALRTAWRHFELDLSNALDQETIVWPESTYGEWQASDGQILSLSDKHILGGARIWVSDDTYTHTLVRGDTGEIVYAQQTPLPLSFGKASRSVSADRLDSDRVNRTPALICFEIVNTWQVAMTFARADESVIWLANLGWSKNGFLAERLLEQVGHWSTLYGKPAVVAINEPEARA